MLLGNDNFVLCKPITSTKEDVSNLNSFFNDSRELVRLEVVLMCKYPDQEKYSDNMLYPKDVIYVRGDFKDSHYNQNVYTLDGLEFIRVPHGEVILIETMYKDASINNR